MRVFTRTYCCQLIGVVILEGADGQLTLDGDAAGRRCEIAASAAQNIGSVGRWGGWDLTDPGLGTQARGVRFCSVGNWGEDGEKMESLTEQEAPEF